MNLKIQLDILKLGREKLVSYVKFMAMNGILKISPHENFIGILMALTVSINACFVVKKKMSLLTTLAL